MILTESKNVVILSLLIGALKIIHEDHGIMEMMPVRIWERSRVYSIDAMAHEKDREF